MPISRALRAIAAAALAACAQPTAEGSLRLVTTDGAFTQAPAPTTIDVTAIDPASGQRASLLHAPLSGTTFDLGDHDVATIAALRVTASDATGRVLVAGQSLPLQLGGLDGVTLSLFVQRTGAFAALPGDWGDAEDARASPLAAVVGDRYVFAAGGSDPGRAAQSRIYDLLTWAPLASPPALPRAPRSIAVQGLRVLLVDDAGATWIDLGDAANVSDAAAPSGGSFAEVAGGATIVADDGAAYVVGGTRASGAPSARVLRVGTGGDLAFVGATAPRLGASAAWLPGRGLLVVGGSATASGAEIVPAGGAPATPLAFPPDATTGAAIATLPDGRAVLAFGVRDGAPAGVRAIDPSCTASCAATTWSGATGLVTASAAVLDAGTILVVGDDASGASRALRVSPDAAQPIDLKAPRKGARLLALPTAAWGIVGGAPTLESFVP